MKRLSAALYTLRAIVRRMRADRELDEELAFHLERETALHVAAGLSPDAARREAFLRFGGVQRYREECRDMRRTHWLDDTRADARFALRLARHYPGFSASVILITALGIAACATTFSLVSGVLLSPLPFANPNRVAALQLSAADGSSTAALTTEAYFRIAAESAVFDAIAAHRPQTAAVDVGGEPELLRVRLVTASYFRVFGISPVVGRVFTDDEATQGEHVVLLGHDAWQTRFGGDASVVGRTLRLSGVPHTIIGVTPRRFRGQVAAFEPAMWAPLHVSPTAANATVSAIARVADGVSNEQANTWLAGNIMARMPGLARTDSVLARATLVPIAELIYGEVERPLLVLLGAVVLVIALVAANVATMFLARTSARARELNVRRALGASTGRELRQLLTESTLLTAIGGVAGVCASYWLIGIIRTLGVEVLPRMENVSLDWRVLLFALAGTLLTGAVGGIAPSLASSRDARLHEGDATSRDTGRRAPSALVVAQIALSVVLVVGAGLLVKGFLRVLPTDPGFALDHRATVFVGLRPEYGFAANDRNAAQQFVRDATARMRQVAGVRDVATTSFLPFTRTISLSIIDIPGQPAATTERRAYKNPVSANFFSVMRISILRGRAFSDADIDGSEPVAIINATAAERWWPGQNPVGQPLRFTDGPDRYNATIVGVVSDARLDGTDTRIRPELFVPAAQSKLRAVSFVVETSVDPRSIATELKRAVWRTNPSLPVTESNDLATMAAESVRRARFFSTAMTAFALAALALSALGVHGLLSFAVARRRREIGIRLALGASSSRIGRMVLGRAAAMGVAGVVIGLGAARLLSRYMESLLLEVGPSDAAVFSLAAVSVLLIAVVAACAPAYHALRVDPVRSVRS